MNQKCSSSRLVWVFAHKAKNSQICHKSGNYVMNPEFKEETLYKYALNLKLSVRVDGLLRELVQYMFACDPWA